MTQVNERDEREAVGKVRFYDLDDNPLLTDDEREALTVERLRRLEDREMWAISSRLAESGIGFNWLSSRTEAWEG